MELNARWTHGFVLAGLVVLLAACAVNVAERTNAGNQHYQRQEYDAALEAYQVAQVIDPDRPEAYFNAAAAYIGSGRLERAIEALEQALVTADDDLAADAYYNLGNIFYELNRCHEAFEAYQQVLLLRPDDDEARYNLEVALMCAIPPTPTALEQQTEPDVDQTDPETTPTDEPGGHDGPTPTPPPQDFDPSATPESGDAQEIDDDSDTPLPLPEGGMTVEQAERLLDQIRQDQEVLREFLQEEAISGEVSQRDW
jgi:tetratricopeptide (TPR) repeat protein